MASDDRVTFTLSEGDAATLYPNLLASARERGDDIRAVERVLRNQYDYKLIDHRWSRSPTFIRDALRSGCVNIEIDVRFDKDRAPWCVHGVGVKGDNRPPLLHELTTEDAVAAGCGMDLPAALRDFAPYCDGRHALIIEFKELGGDPDAFPEYLDVAKKIIASEGVKDSIVISSLSPCILMAAHKAMPEAPLILNAGPVPGVWRTREASGSGAYPEAPVVVIDAGNEGADADPDADVRRGKVKYRTFRFGKAHEVVSSGADELVVRADGYGKLTSYLLAQLPGELLEVMRAQHKSGHRLGGIITLSPVTWIASVLDNIGMKNRATRLRRKYAEELDKLGVGRMATTYNQDRGARTRLSHLSPENQTLTFKRDLGKQTLIYTKSPEAWASNLPDLSQE